MDSGLDGHQGLFRLQGSRFDGAIGLLSILHRPHAAGQLLQQRRRQRVDQVAAWMPTAWAPSLRWRAEPGHDIADTRTRTEDLEQQDAIAMPCGAPNRKPR
jgi:hypothetical protein